METIIIRIKDASRRSFLLELLSQLDFIDFNVSRERTQPGKDADFFQAAGLFAQRQIDADQLRKQAWRLKD